MHGFPLRLASSAVTLSLLFAGCATTPPPPPAKTSRTASSHKMKPVVCVATRESTRQQREVAEANARRVYFSKKSKRRMAMRKRRARYVAVQTVRNTDSTGDVSCMVFDVQTEKLIGTTVFDCDRAPQIGETIKFATFSATYVGG